MHACIFAHLCPLEVIAVSGDGATHCMPLSAQVAIIAFHCRGHFISLWLVRANSTHLIMT